MKWQHYLTFVCFAFLGLFVGSFIINQKNSASAVSDIIYTIDSSNYTNYVDSSGRYFCSIYSSPSCNGYHYLSIRTSVSFDYTDDSIISSFRNLSIIFSQPMLGSYSVPNLDYKFFEYPSSVFYFNDLTSIAGLKFYITTSSVWSSFFLSYPDASVILTLSENNPFSSGVPSGSLSITENGTYDVTNYAEAVVEVPNTETIIQGDYHDDLVSINNSIMVCAGVCLVLYFFYCIYRMFINTGGK